MDDPCLHLHYKAWLTLRANENTGSSIWQEALHFLHAYISQMMDVRIDFLSFQSHGKLESENGRISALIASHTGEPPLYQKKWAIRIRIYDPDYKGRKWYVHIGLRQDSADQPVMLGYLETYIDNIAEIVTLSRHIIPPPKAEGSLFIHTLLQDTLFDCSIGRYRMPDFGIALTRETVSSFLELLAMESRVSTPVIKCQKVPREKCN